MKGIQGKRICKGLVDIVKFGSKCRQLVDLFMLLSVFCVSPIIGLNDDEKDVLYTFQYNFLDMNINFITGIYELLDCVYCLCYIRST